VCDLGRTRFAHHRDSDLSRVGQLVLDLLRNLAGDDLGGEIVHVGRLHHHAHLAPGLHREHLLDARLAARDLLDARQPLDVRLE